MLKRLRKLLVVLLIPTFLLGGCATPTQESYYTWIGVVGLCVGLLIITYAIE